MGSGPSSLGDVVLPLRQFSLHSSPRHSLGDITFSSPAISARCPLPPETISYTCYRDEGIEILPAFDRQDIVLRLPAGQGELGLLPGKCLDFSGPLTGSP